MKHYLAIFTGSPVSMDAWNSMDAAQREAKEKAGMAAWKAWAEKNQAAIVDHGAPLGKTKQVTRLMHAPITISQQLVQLQAEARKSVLMP